MKGGCKWSRLSVRFSFARHLKEQTSIWAESVYIYCTRTLLHNLWTDMMRNEIHLIMLNWLSKRRGQSPTTSVRMNVWMRTIKDLSLDLLWGIMLAMDWNIVTRSNSFTSNWLGSLLQKESSSTDCRSMNGWVGQIENRPNTFDW